MRDNRRPLFEVVTPAADEAARALTTAANVRTIIGSLAGDDAVLTVLINRASAEMAKCAKLARDTIGTPPTFGAEACRATWPAAGFGLYIPAPWVVPGEGESLVLPWRTPVSEIASIVEDAVTLAEGVDFRSMPGGVLERLRNDAVISWSRAKIVVEFTAGYDLPAEVPDDLEAAAIEQVKFWYASRKRDPSVRSETVPDVYQGAYSVAGGDSIGASGLLVSVEGVLSAYKDWSQG